MADARRLVVFQIADALVLDVYVVTRRFPTEERFGLTSQLRRGIVSVPTNLIEGAARATTRDFAHFATIAYASACEVAYLIEVAHRLGFLDDATLQVLQPRLGDLVKGLAGLKAALQSRARKDRPREAH